MKSVFLVKTPLQLLNALEARYHFVIPKQDSVLIIMGDRKSQPQILALAQAMHEWGSVIVLNQMNLFFGDPLKCEHLPWYKDLFSSNVFSKSFSNVRRLNRINKRLGKVDYIFIGYARYIYMTHFMNVMPHNKTVLLDDGNATLQLAIERKQGVLPSLKFKKKIKLAAKKLFQRVKDEARENLIFFTMYDIAVANNDQLVRNSFKKIKSDINERGLTDDIYFVGSPISESNFVSEQTYLDQLKKIKEYYCGKNLIYIAHRREHPEKLKKISQLLQINTIIFEYPIEYQLAIVGPRPKVLASFFSSAIDSCQLIFADSILINVFKLIVDDVPEREKIKQIYHLYESLQGEKFKIISKY
ncbi:MAG: hypothetical protein GQ549_05685 [Gammaproteobacteria bacterium]|nr:hypothetical protein [Gammaproteobacteria bacterium]